MSNIQTGNSYVSWGAILAGAVLACAVSVVLLQFGAAVGLSVTDVVNGDNVISRGRVFGTAFFVLWIQVIASLVGGYFAGRLRTPVTGAKDHEIEIRDGAHGLLVWATATLAVALGAAAVAAFGALAPHDIEPVVRKTPEMLANEKAVTIITAFSAAATSLVSGIASWAAAVKGGDHRDNEADLSHYFSFKG